MTNGKHPGDRQPRGSFGTRELLEAKRKHPLGLVEPVRRAAPAAEGFDPYNTTGSFDRRKNWERVGKR